MADDVNVEAIAMRVAAQRASSLGRLREVGKTAVQNAKALAQNRQDNQARLALMESEFAVRTGGSFSFWPTPYDLTRRMVQMAGVEPGMKVLEPSAGTGRIANAIRAAGVEPVCVEIDSMCCDILVLKGYGVEQCDFMEYEKGGFDAIVANPPFKQLQDVYHIRHVYDLLADGGVLVAVMAESAFFRQFKQDAAFRVWFAEHGGESEKLPPDTFKGSGTSVQTRLVRMVKGAV